MQLWRQIQPFLLISQSSSRPHLLMFSNYSLWLLIRQPTKLSHLLIISRSITGLLNPQPPNGPHPLMMSSSIPWFLISHQTHMARSSSPRLLKPSPQMGLTHS